MPVPVKTQRGCSGWRNQMGGLGRLSVKTPQEEEEEAQQAAQEQH